MIKLCITTPNGTKIELDIPISEDASTKSSDTSSAVTILADTQTTVEQAETSVGEQQQVVSVNDDMTDKSKDKSSPLDEIPREILLGREGGEGEVGEGVRGGVGEKEGEVGEGRRERNPIHNRSKQALKYNGTPLEKYKGIDEIGFQVRDGSTWHCPYAAIDNLLNLYSHETIRRQFLFAKGWLIADEKRLKTYDGMTRFINGWMSRHESYAGASKPVVESSNLLKTGNANSEGW